eukprot:UN11276
MGKNFPRIVVGKNFPQASFGRSTRESCPYYVNLSKKIQKIDKKAFKNSPSGPAGLK